MAGIDFRGFPAVSLLPGCRIVAGILRGLATSYEDDNKSYRRREQQNVVVVYLLFTS